MKRSSQAFLAAAAIATALCLTGCKVPDFVYGYCGEALLPSLGQASIDGLNKVSAQCQKTFTAMSQINLCIMEGQQLLHDAKKKTMTHFTEKCADYVRTTVCIEGSKCYESPEKITPDMARPAVADYVKTHMDSLKDGMQNVMDTKIKQIVNMDYNDKYRNRAVPLTVQAQCGNDIEVKLGERNLLLAPTQKIYDACLRFARNSYWTKQCQNEGLRAVISAQRRRTEEFKKRCAHAALEAVCPKGSACAIETSGANTALTAQAAVSFLWQNYQTWVTNLESELLRLAGNTRPYTMTYSKLFDEFDLPAWQGGAMLSLAGLGAVVGGVGCVAAAARYSRRRGTTSAGLLPVDTLEPIAEE